MIAAREKITQERAFINPIITAALKYEEYRDPEEMPLSCGDIQGMVEAFSAQHGYTFDEEETLQDRLDLEIAIALADHAEQKRIGFS